MAVYTHFGGMTGLWRAVRQEGFTRLAKQLALVQVSPDPVADLMALGAAYTRNALANPYLYRTMFDAAVDLENPEVADAGSSAWWPRRNVPGSRGGSPLIAIRLRSRRSSGRPATDWSCW